MYELILSKRNQNDSIPALAKLMQRAFDKKKEKNVDPVFNIIGFRRSLRSILISLFAQSITPLSHLLEQIRRFVGSLKSHFKR